MDTRLIDAADIVIQVLEETSDPSATEDLPHSSRSEMSEEDLSERDFSNEELHQAIRFLIRLGYFDHVETKPRDQA